MMFRYKQTFLYGICLALLLLVLRWLEVRFIIFQHSFELYAAGIAILFTALGIWLALKLGKPKIVEKEIYITTSSDFVLNENSLAKLGLSTRELEVLQLMSAGKSNQEIADELFLSLNTIKTHSSRLFEKMEVKRRTQAVELGKKLGLIP
ncbi:response regulator transcription factor [Pedobacter sp. Du54]|uniref:response regulator transcription factor n=1 Tax=Pedobacter anseongensis TaxID=3133439 RepID=UPI0030AC89F5